MKVRDLLHEVGSKCGVEASIIDNIDLDNVIEQVIARNVSCQIVILFILVNFWIDCLIKDKELPGECCN